MRFGGLRLVLPVAKDDGAGPSPGADASVPFDDLRALLRVLAPAHR